MAMNNQRISTKTVRTASVIVLAFAAIFLLFGQGMFHTGSAPVATAKALQAHGLPGTVSDARVNVGRTNGDLHVLRMELSIVGSDGSTHVMETTHFPRFYPPVNSERGWIADFATKDEIIGQPVSYSLGEKPAVELDSEIPALASAGWSFPNYLGLALMVMGVAAAVGAIIALVRTRRGVRKE